MELSVESHWEHFTWKVQNFFQLPLKNDYFLDSLAFHFAGDRYFLRLYPKSNECRDRAYAKIYLVRLTTIVPERNVSYKIGHRWKMQEGSEIESYHCSRAVLQKFPFEIPRYYMEENRDYLVPDGTLTVLCSMRLQEQSGSGSLQSDEAETPKEEEEDQEELAEHSVFFSPCWMSFTTELSIKSSHQYITWKVRDFFQLPSENNYYIESTEFRFFDDTYRLRLYPNGNVNWNPANIDFELVRMTSFFPDVILSVKFGYKYGIENGQEVEAYHCPDIPQKEIFRFYIERSELEEKRNRFVPGGTLILLCSMSLRDHNVAGSTHSGETESSDAEDKKEELPSVAKVKSNYSNYMWLLEAA